MILDMMTCDSHDVSRFVILLLLIAFLQQNVAVRRSEIDNTVSPSENHHLHPKHHQHHHPHPRILADLEPFPWTLLRSHHHFPPYCSSKLLLIYLSLANAILTNHHYQHYDLIPCVRMLCLSM